MWLEQREKAQLLLFYLMYYELEVIQLVVILGKILRLCSYCILKFQPFLVSNMALWSSV